MQADNGASPIYDRFGAKAQQAGRNFNRWARGGQVSAPGTNPGLLNKGLEAAARPQSAQSILEFLLVSVPLLTLIFAILEIGLAFFESTNLDYSAQEAARSVSVCANGCDVLNGTTLYRDYNMLRALNRVNLRLENVEYVIIQHVGEQVDDPAGSNTPDLGRTGPDIYNNYKYHWQLYALPKSDYASSDPRKNSVPARGDGDALGVRLNDALCTQIPLLTSSGNCLIPKDTYNDQYNGFRSNACFSDDADTICRKQIPVPDINGNAVTPAAYTATWPGRYICVPTDRFYVQIVYRHNWITPFMPTLNLDGKSPAMRGFGSSNSLILSSKVYQKVEPRQFAGASGSGGCQS